MPATHEQLLVIELSKVMETFTSLTGQRPTKLFVGDYEYLTLRRMAIIRVTGGFRNIMTRVYGMDVYRVLEVKHMSVSI